MKPTPVCDLLGIAWPIIQAGMGSWTSPALVAAVSNAGGLGSLGTATRPMEALKLALGQLQELTTRPFAVNFTLYPSPINAEAFALALQAQPRLISFALGDPGEYVQRAHAAGALVMHQVTTVQQAYQAAERGVDIIIAQGSEAGGFGGSVASLALISQVVDAVQPVPVIAAGGIADGRGLAAALMLGAQGVNIGTRFLASTEAPISEDWKRAILAAHSEDAIKVEFWADLFPAGDTAYPVLPRTLHSTFVDTWLHHRSEAHQAAGQLRDEIGVAITQGTFGDLLPFTGQTAGLIQQIKPAAQIVHEIVAEAEAAMRRTLHLLD